MAKYAYINNRLLKENEAQISVFDRSYLYGEGVFETLRAYNGHAAFCGLHYERLKRNCTRLNIDMPVDKHGFEKAILKTINANRIKDAYIRVTLSSVGASFGLEKPKKMSTNFSIFCREFKGRPKELYEKGARVILVKNVPCDHPIMAVIKSTNYLNKMMARDEVIRAKADEGIFCTPEGKVLEGSATNIFIVKKGEIYTPPLSDGVLPGITRSIVIELAEGIGLPMHETPVSLTDLKNCDEVFLTGSTTEILPIRELINTAKKSPTPGPVTKQVMEAYRSLLP